MCGVLRGSAFLLVERLPQLAQESGINLSYENPFVEPDGTGAHAPGFQSGMQGECRSTIDGFEEIRPFDRLRWAFVVCLLPTQLVRRLIAGYLVDDCPATPASFELVFVF